ncbi:motility associated factor glycosyltransferase family protein [Thiomicrorhabdus xiamenensis]|uniref:DUF115 domain-containing protein n=1 Tax=Thiomicrorhabdus xiamenensis TaxID=2739063 RepID=A0A7D4SSL7_9GAMM|nr:6-hydroxymethylpterin diphosphokinase MptE-like protein [Thiomicrorhabdus xiamenensis]QKI89563.1 DUF115 domain-containing protein [Thiomicrorhabdus xiamenensis]
MDFNLGPLSQNKYGDSYYESLNGLSFTKKSSEMVFEKEFADLVLQKDVLNVFVGSDSGLLYEYLKNHPELPESTSYVFIELPEVIESRELNDIEEKSIFVVPSDYDLALLAVSHMNYVVQQRVRLVRSIGVLDSQPESIMRALWTSVEERYNKFISKELISLNSKPFIDAQLNNLADNNVPFINLRQALEGTTALILGGGPTLDQSIEWIRENREGMVIFSAARIARRLAKEGITPDFFISVDPHDVSFDNSKGIFQFADQSVLLNSYHINSAILSQWSGLKAYTGAKFPWLTKGEENLNAPGPNVINTALHLAFELGCENFIFSGVDLCFPGGQAYESSSDEAQIGGTFMFSDLQKVKNNAGKWVSTQPRYAISRDTIEQQVKHYKGQNAELNFLHLSLDAAYIEGVSYIPQESISFTDTEQTLALMSELRTQLSLSPEEVLKHLQSTKKQIEKQKRRFLDLINEAKQAVKFIPKLYSDGQEDSKIVKKVLKAKNKVNKLIGEDGDTLFHYDYSSFTGSFQHVSDETNMSQEEVSEQLHSFFNGVQQATERFLEQIRLSEQRLQLRERELKTRQNLSPLFSEWEKLNQFGRALCWQNWHGVPEQDEDRLIIEESIGLFRDVLQVKETKQVANLKKRSTNLKSLYQRIEKAYRDRDSQELYDSLDFMSKQEWPEQETSLKLDIARIAEAMWMELNNQEAEALLRYQSVVTPFLRHNALKFALGISTRQADHSSTLNILEQLCHFSLEYMVPYADMLDLMGSKEAASGVLEMYLQKHPQDAQTQLKQVQHLIDLQRFDQARQRLESFSREEAASAYQKTLAGLAAQLP